MKVLVNRVSEYKNMDKAPCEGAKKELYTRIDERNVCSVEQLSERNRIDWFKYGENHRTLPNGHIARDNPKGKGEGWFIEINTLEELIDFINKTDDVIIYQNSQFIELHIYDDYIE